MNRTQGATISVICPTYNSALFIEPTIRSVLDQTTSVYELIISDDGSSDATKEVVERVTTKALIPVGFLSNAHAGPGAARNAGIRAATGEWIAFLDSDDRWDQKKIAYVVSAIAEYPEINFFCHDAYHRFHDGREVQMNLPRRYQNMVIARQLFRSCPFATSAVVCRRDLLIRHGLFDEDLPSAQDFELWLRLSPFLRVQYLPEVLVWYNDRLGNISSGHQWRHLKNILWALSHNRRNTKMSWYIAGLVRHLAIFSKNQIIKALGYL